MSENTEKKGTKRITFDKKSLIKGKKEFQLREQEVEVPELNLMMGLEKDEVVIMLVRQMNFDELMKIQSENFDMMRNLVEGVLEASASKEAVRDEVSRALDKQSSITTQRIDTVFACLVDPKLSRSEVIYICKMFPSVAMRLYTAIINLTNKGADLKKNSIG
jgi:hypothetical protein